MSSSGIGNKGILFLYEQFDIGKLFPQEFGKLTNIPYLLLFFHFVDSVLIGFAWKFKFVERKFLLKLFEVRMCEMHLRLIAGCGGVFEGESGQITSPNYPEKYLAHMYCIYVINALVCLTHLLIVEYLLVSLERFP